VGYGYFALSLQYLGAFCPLLATLGCGTELSRIPKFFPDIVKMHGWEGEGAQTRACWLPPSRGSWSKGRSEGQAVGATQFCTGRDFYFFSCRLWKTNTILHIDFLKAIKKPQSESLGPSYEAGTIPYIISDSLC